MPTYTTKHNINGWLVVTSTSLQAADRVKAPRRHYDSGGFRFLMGLKGANLFRHSRLQGNIEDKEA